MDSEVISSMWIALSLLFGSSFLSATLLPGNSELALGMFFRQWPHAWGLAVVVASCGNTLGGMTSWWLGRLVKSDQLKPKVLATVRQYGVWLLLLSWVPVVGDALCVAAGWLRTPWLATLIMMLIGKAIRYLVVIWIMQVVSS